MYLVKMCYWTNEHSFVSRCNNVDTIKEARRYQIKWMTALLRELVGENALDMINIVLDVHREQERNEMIAEYLFDVIQRTIQLTNAGDSPNKKRFEISIESPSLI